MYLYCQLNPMQARMQLSWHLCSLVRRRQEAKLLRDLLFYTYKSRPLNDIVSSIKLSSQPFACLQRISGIWNFDVGEFMGLSGIFLRIIFYSDKKFLSTIIYMSGNSVPCSLKLHTQKLHSKASVYFPRRFCDCIWLKAPSHEVFVHEKTTRRITLMNGCR